MNLYLRVYLGGHSGRVMPRWLRRIAARSELHRAWLCGFNGCFVGLDSDFIGYAGV